MAVSSSTGGRLVDEVAPADAVFPGFGPPFAEVVDAVPGDVAAEVVPGFVSVDEFDAVPGTGKFLELGRTTVLGFLIVAGRGRAVAGRAVVFVETTFVGVSVMVSAFASVVASDASSAWSTLDVSCAETQLANPIWKARAIHNRRPGIRKQDGFK